MNLKTWIPLILALVLGLVAAVAARQMMMNRSTAAAEAPDLKEVVVARNNLVAGTAIRADDLMLGKIETEFDSGAVFVNPADLEGRVVQAPVFKGLPVLASQLAPKGMGGGLQALVPEGMRAITVEVNEISGVGGFLVPGCHVDVIGTMQGERSGELVSRTIVQKVKVTAVGQRLTLAGEGDSKEPLRSVTLIATPKEAEMIELAASVGKPRLVLRSGGDESVGHSDGITVAELRGKASQMLDPFAMPAGMMPATQPADANDPFTRGYYRIIKVIRGGVESDFNLSVPARSEAEQRAMSSTIEPGR